MLGGVGAAWTDLVPLPDGLSNQSGHTHLEQSTMKEIFGAPCSFKTTCQPVTNKKLKRFIKLESVGPFRVTGMKPAIGRLRTALSNLLKDYPDLYNRLGSAGMLCCRAVRGSSSRYSNHAWGAAIDFTIDGKLSPRGDGKTQRGLLTLYPYMSEQGFFWGAGFRAKYEDPMHFEISEQTMRQWASDGTLGQENDGPGVDDCAWPLLKRGKANPNNHALQYLLKYHGWYSSKVDGIFGSGTHSSVRLFQRAKGLTADGIVGKNTWVNLWGNQTLGSGAKGEHVKAIQKLLNLKRSAGLKLDGDFGPKTKSAVIKFQTERRYTDSGSVSLTTFKGMITWCSGSPNKRFSDHPSNSSSSGYQDYPEDNNHRDDGSTADGSNNDPKGQGNEAVIGLALILGVSLFALIVIRICKSRKQNAAVQMSEGEEVRNSMIEGSNTIGSAYKSETGPDYALMTSPDEDEKL
ncbi:hypothetical protein AAMO2058_001052900 [Amorphochlora amoebiformis]